MHVPGGCPPPNRLSQSRSPVDVRVIPPVHGLVPGNPNNNAELVPVAAGPAARRRKVEAMVARNFEWVVAKEAGDLFCF